uniref:Uncharacterized protein n=1 Tax=Octopus bimaculoides TaxID=37653 RepID=A0A0L8FFL3_OCTBM
MKRYLEKIDLSWVRSPITYRETVVCQADSSRRQYSNLVNLRPRITAVSYTERVVVAVRNNVGPAMAEEQHEPATWVSKAHLDIEECCSWFKTTLDVKAKTITLIKTPQHR